MSYNVSTDTSRQLKFNEVLKQLVCRGADGGGSRTSRYQRIPFEILAQVSQILTEYERTDWAGSPRLYTILFLIGEEQQMRKFVEYGISDIAIPLRDCRWVPLKKDQGEAFIEAQRYLITNFEGLDAADKVIHLHGHFDDGDEYFEKKKDLGQGAFGYVDSVISVSNKKVYARKRILKDIREGELTRILQEFSKELEVFKALSHRHLVKFHYSYTDRDYVTTIMTPVARWNLATYLERPHTPQFPKEDFHELRRFFGCLASGLQYLHHKQIRHKDIKPANLLVTEAGNILIADFGSALDWKESGRSTTIEHDQQGLTEDYCSPESLIPGTKRDSSSDVFSLGVVYFEMLTILGGQSLPSMREFLRSTGSKTTVVSRNESAKAQWLDRLSPELRTSDDVWPIPWIQQMTDIDPEKRLLSNRLWIMTRGSSLIPRYCCDKCRLDFASMSAPRFELRPYQAASSYISSPLKTSTLAATNASVLAVMPGGFRPSPSQIPASQRFFPQNQLVADPMFSGRPAPMMGMGTLERGSIAKNGLPSYTQTFSQQSSPYYPGIYAQAAPGLSSPQSGQSDYKSSPYYPSYLQTLQNYSPSPYPQNPITTLRGRDYSLNAPSVTPTSISNENRLYLAGPHASMAVVSRPSNISTPEPRSTVKPTDGEAESTSTVPRFQRPPRNAAITIHSPDGRTVNLASLKPDVEKPKDLTDTRTATVSSILKAETHPDKHISLLAPAYPIWQEWKRERDRDLELENSSEKQNLKWTSRATRT